MMLLDKQRISKVCTNHHVVIMSVYTKFHSNPLTSC